MENNLISMPPNAKDMIPPPVTLTETPIETFTRNDIISMALATSKSTKDKRVEDDSDENDSDAENDTENRHSS